MIVVHDDQFVRNYLAHDDCPKIVQLDVGNASPEVIEQLLRLNLDRLRDFSTDSTARLLVVTKAPGTLFF